ncbi:hypothetical protein CYLTODRAFT_425906 [Cylindrobasidium torrendii FP15055 ss-10]|uniref:S-adenosyl-L-methionine-dependent methyltransferase n=1 Tax=Cylindrobasidium torrendii FP15055 ss-10 TaxID=1314674 RepID=A0A0D7AZJ3_9AGAR|nr:hypothetical protein CYLTODRAFT_425906 [Cylindrobasidium torrendii FP15055 ss-10]
MDSQRAGPILLHEDSLQVTDADEEIFLLYSELQAAPQEVLRGLGHVDSRKNILTVDIEISSPEMPSSPKSHHHGRSSKKAAKAKPQRSKTISLDIAQDITGLRSREGDTGSVVWKASVDFAQLVLQQLTYGTSSTSLFDKELLSKSRVVELGAGTGILGMALHSYVGQYIATDMASMIHLIKKNISSNVPNANNLSVAELDWVALQSTPAHLRRPQYELGSPDLIISVDCIYHPALVPAFVEAVEFVAGDPGAKTTVLVIIELREQGAATLLLELWLKNGWEVWRLGRDTGPPSPYVAWVAKKAA